MRYSPPNSCEGSLAAKNASNSRNAGPCAHFILLTGSFCAAARPLAISPSVSVWSIISVICLKYSVGRDDMLVIVLVTVSGTCIFVKKPRAEPMTVAKIDRYGPVLAINGFGSNICSEYIGHVNKSELHYTYHISKMSLDNIPCSQDDL